MSLDDVHPYEWDRRLFSELGLRTEGWTTHDWNDLGTVVVEEEDDEKTPTRPAAEVRVEVYALPAQFFRFTILRPIDDTIPTPRERIVIETGSGSFRDYWPTAKLIAEHRMKVAELGHEEEESDASPDAS